MIPAAKRSNLTLNKIEKKNEAESGFLSQVNFSCTTTSSALITTNEASRKSCQTSSRGSLQQLQSFSSSSGYSSASNVSASLFVSPVKSNRKRKSEVSSSDENFYNSYQFVSPLKIAKRDANDKNRAKLVLKEKCPSENVILSSTPIRNEQRATKWGKFRSFHPEKLKFGSSFHENSIETAPVKESNESSFNFSSFELSNASFNADIPSDNLQNLLAGTIKTDEKPKIPERKRDRLDILGILFCNYKHISDKILGYMDDGSLLRLSHVSQQWREMITSNKKLETKRKSYLKKHKKNDENKYAIALNRTSSDTTKKRPFGDSNLMNQSQMILRQRPLSPPHSPKRLTDQQRIKSKKCPRCRKPALIQKILIRKSPRKDNNNKKKTSILNLSPNRLGRVTKRSSPRVYHSKTTSIYVDSFSEAQDIKCLTLPSVFGGGRRSSSSSLSGSDDSTISNCEEAYEYAVCASAGCCYKFCVKCNCKYHPSRSCGDLSPPSPTRHHKSMAACTSTSHKMLKRLMYD